MVIVKLIGGVGNQMFQYAAGRSMAHRLGTTMKLDISLFKYYPDRFYALKYFNIQENIAASREIFLVSGKPQNIRQKIYGWAKKILSIRGKLGWNKHNVTANYDFLATKPIIYNEPHFHCDLDFFKIVGDVYMNGYWQSEKYFINIEDIIRSEFVLKTPPDGKNLELAEQIQNCESVSVHIRRGDYISNAAVRQLMEVCDLDYYHNSINTLLKIVGNPCFFIFSDDFKWANDNLNLDYPVIFVQHNGPEKNYEDIRLMSLCKYNIIANSSFSWWGAWLNANPEKVIISPKIWFKDNSIDTKDLLPKGWMKI